MTRKPNDLAPVWSCTVIVALSPWSWLSADEGLHRHNAVVAELDDHPHLRTRQRRMARAKPLAMTSWGRGRSWGRAGA